MQGPSTVTGKLSSLSPKESPGNSVMVTANDDDGKPTFKPRSRLERIIRSYQGGQALKFLELLDPRASRVFTSQTYDDSHDPNTGKPDPKLAVILHDEFDNVLEAGCGI